MKRARHDSRERENSSKWRVGHARICSPSAGIVVCDYCDSEADGDQSKHGITWDGGLVEEEIDGGDGGGE